MLKQVLNKIKYKQVAYISLYKFVTKLQMWNNKAKLVHITNYYWLKIKEIILRNKNFINCILNHVKNI
jgi:hypothetical protein